MKSSNQKTSLTLLVGLLYAYLFHEAELGLNVLLFDAIALIIFLKTEPEMKCRPLFPVAVSGLLFSAVAVVIVNSWLASFAHSLSFVFVLGVARVREIRFFWFALLLGVQGVIIGPWDWYKTSRFYRKSKATARLPKLRKVMLPALLIAPFFLLYYQASPAFASFVSALLRPFDFDLPNVWSLLLFCWGLLLAAAMNFPRSGGSYLLNWAAGFRDYIPRRKASSILGLPAFRKGGTLGLKHEYRLAFGSLLGLNALLLLVNLTDVFTVWLSTANRTAAELSQFVHAGTYLLLLSIFLAVLLILVFFRGNLNYYSKVPILRKLAFVWIAQNALLALSVGVRNLHYISAYGLAWGRLEVFFLLLVLLIGLFTLYRKVGRRLSLTYLLHNNGLALWLCLLTFSMVNWDGVITRYNLQHPGWEGIDHVYLIRELGDRNAFLLCRQDVANKLSDDFTLKHKLRPESHRPADWRSWNYADYRNYQATRNFNFKALHLPRREN